MSQDVPTGQRFSHVYMDRGRPTADSQRMRVRLYELITDCASHEDVAGLLRRELGIEIDTYEVEDFFKTSALQDILDSVTLTFRLVAHKERQIGPRTGLFVRQVDRIFREENVGYRIDNEGGVHFTLDEEFERVRVTAIQGLGRTRYRAVLCEFERAHAALDATPPDTKTAARAAFESVEVLFKLLCGDTKCQKLGTAEIGTFLKPQVEKVYGKEPTAKQATALLVNSMANWVSAVHFYRHGQAIEEPTPPPLEVCVVMLSQAATYLRWLVELDERLTLVGT